MGLGDRSVIPGLLISLEGLDGVGKTTQLERLREWLTSESFDVLTVREPGGTPLGEALRHLILHRVEAQSGLAEFLVFAAARAELMETVIEPALRNGAVVLMDRFIDSSVAYQGFGRGLDKDRICAINRMVTADRAPDLTVWLKGEPFPREEPDQVERRDPNYFGRVSEGYAWLVQDDPRRWLVLDSRQHPDIIFETLQHRIRLILQGKRGGEA